MRCDPGFRGCANNFFLQKSGIKRKAFNMDHFYKTFVIFFVKTDWNNIYCISSIQQCRHCTRTLKQLELNYQSKIKSKNLAKWSIIWTRACNMDNSGSEYGP